jgi:ribose/xylose/arabinose/galactoside ABC-type transport system permease subunit
MSDLDISPRPILPVEEEDELGGRRYWLLGLDYLRRTPAIPVLALFVAAGAVIFDDAFFSARNFASIAVASSFLLIVSVGMTLVIVSGGIDLSVGSMLALGAVVTAYASQWGSPAAVVAPLLVCTLIGLTQGFLIGVARMPAFIVTLAGLLFARGLAFKISDNGNTTHLIPDGEWVTVLGQGSLLGVGLPAWLGLLVLLVGTLVLYRTPTGLAAYAVGGSEEAASLMGVRVVRTKIALYSVLGLLCGIAGLLVAARSSSGLSTIGAGFELKAIAAVVIGGTLLTGGFGGLTGTLAGVLLLGVIENLINQIGTLSSFHQLVASGAFLIIVVSAQSLLARRELRRSRGLA